MVCINMKVQANIIHKVVEEKNKKLSLEYIKINKKLKNLSKDSLNPNSKCLG
jgi:hypothetical protein